MRTMEQRDNGFVIQEEGKEVAEITYVLDGQTMTVDHTFVSEELRGQKVGDQLARAVAEYAREQGYKIVPACSFADAWFRRHKEYGDLLQQ